MEIGPDVVGAVLAVVLMDLGRMGLAELDVPLPGFDGAEAVDYRP